MLFKSGIPIVPSNGSGTAPDAAGTPAGVEVSFDAGANRNRQATIGVLITNREVAPAGNSLEVSFSNSATWFTIPPGMTISFPAITHRVQLRGASGGTSDYSVMGIV